MENTDTAVNYVIYLDSFALSLKVEGLRPHTISCYVRDAYRLGERSGWIPPAKLKTAHVRDYINWLSARVQPSTVTAAQLGLRRFFRFLVDEQEIATDPSAKIKLVRFKVEPQPTYSLAEIAGLLAALAAFTSIDEEAETKNYREQMNFVVDQIEEIPGIVVKVEHNYDHYIPHAVVTFAENWKGPSYSEIADRMKAADPRVYVAVDYRDPARKMWIDPLNLQDGEVEIVAEQFRKILIDGASGK